MQLLRLFLLCLLATFFTACEDGAISADQPSDTVRYEFLRNAAARLSYDGKVFLLDPMLSDKGALPSFAGVAPNPTVDLPKTAQEIVSGIDAVIVGHMHADHFDMAAAEVLPKDTLIITPDNEAPVNPADPQNTTMSFEAQLAQYGFDNVQLIGGPDGPSTRFDGVEMTQEFGLHGKGVLSPLMGGVNGIVFQADGQPTIYWTGDTILDEEGRVAAILAKYAPDIVIAHTGGAVIAPISPDPLMMDEAQAVAFFKAAKAANPEVQIVAVHMEALDHCMTTRQSLGVAIAATPGLSGTVITLPLEGETVVFN